MRSNHKAAQLRHDRALEEVLEHHRGAEILAASGGDAEHALRIIEELKARAPSSNVIRLPRDPILSFEDVLDRDAEELELAPLGLGSWSWRSIATFAAVGLVLWAIIAGVAFGLFRLVQAVLG